VMEEHVGGRIWRSMGRWPRQLKEAACLVLRWFLTMDGGSEAHKSGAGWSALGAKECGDEGAEADGESRAEWAGVQRLSREEERRLLLWTDSATR
jgi:hypothetical protein